jgi:glycyl-tRNA synthetase (class II)
MIIHENLSTLEVLTFSMDRIGFIIVEIGAVFREEITRQNFPSG